MRDATKFVLYYLCWLDCQKFTWDNWILCLCWLCFLHNYYKTFLTRNLYQKIHQLNNNKEFCLYLIIYIIRLKRTRISSFNLEISSLPMNIQNDCWLMKGWLFDLILFLFLLCGWQEAAKFWQVVSCWHHYSPQYTWIDTISTFSEFS